MKNFPIITLLVLIIISLIFFWQRFFIGYPVFFSVPDGVLTVSDFLANFSHFAVFHFILNAIALFWVGRILEYLIGRKKFLVIFFAITLFTTLGMEYFSPTPAIGSSGVILGIFIFLGILVRKNKEFFHSILRLTLLNIAIGFVPGVSLAGHIIGVLAGILVYMIYGGIQILLSKGKVSSH